MKVIIFFILNLSVFTANASENWERKATGPFYVEYFGEINKIDGIATLQMLRDYNEEIEFDGFLIKSVQTFREFDCGDKTTKVQKYTGYADQMGEGEILFQKTGEDSWETVDSMTFLEFALKSACKV